MASRYELELTVSSAKDLKNVNWRHGDLRPYTVVWVDTSTKCSTKVDVDGDTSPLWDEKLTIPLPGYDRRSAIDDAFLYLDVVHANADEDVKSLVGSARLSLREVVDEGGVGGKVTRSLKLKRPSGRPQGRVEVKLCVREPSRYYDQPLYGAPYGQQVPPGSSTRDISRSYGYDQPPQVGYSYGAPPPTGYPYGAPPPSGYPYGGAPPPTVPSYGQAPAYGGQAQAYGGQAPAYGGQAPSYGSAAAAPPVVEKKKSKFGMGTGLAVGAAAGVLGGLALAEGIDYVGDKIADNAAEKVEDDLGGGFDGYDDDY